MSDLQTECEREAQEGSAQPPLATLANRVAKLEHDLEIATKRIKSLENKPNGPLHLARPLDDVVQEIIDVLHENVQFFDSDGDHANHEVLNGIQPRIKEALCRCCEAS
jgi:hypothetical protein